MANVGKVDVVLGVDSSKLKEGVAKAAKVIEDLGNQFDKIGTNAAASVSKAEKAVQKVASETKQSLSKVEQAYAKASYGVDEFSLAYHEMARKVVADSKRIEDSADRTTRSMGDKFGAAGSKMTAVGTKMSMGLTAPMLLAGRQAIKAANEFEFSMQSIVAMVGLSEDKVAEMGVAARAMAIEFGGSATEAADALYFVASAGIDGATAMEVLESSLKASAIGMGDTSIIADTVSSALNAYGIANLSAAQATDVMVAAVREGKMEADALAGALPRVLPIASAMGVSFNEVGATFAAMSRNGTDASEAATQLRGILSSLLQPTKEAEETMNSLGFSSEGLRQQIKEKGLLDTLLTLTTAFGDNEAAQAAVFGNVRALTGVMSMFGAATESTTTIFANLADNTGDTDKAFQAMSETGAFQMKQAMAQVKDAFISLGQILVPIIVPALKFVTAGFEKVMAAINAMPNFVKTIIVVLAGLLAAAGPVLIMLGMLAKAFLAVKAAMATQAFVTMTAQFAAAGPIIAGVAIAALAVVAAYSMFSANAAAAKERQEALTESLRMAGEPTVVLTDKIGTLIDEYVALQGAAEGAATGIGEEFSGAQAFTAAELGAGVAILAKYGGDINTLTDYVSTGTDAFGDLATKILGGTKDIQTAITQTESLTDAQAAMFMALANSGELDLHEFYMLANTLDLASDAFDDNRDALNKTNEEYITGADGIAYFASVLGFDAFNAIVETAKATADAAGRTDVYTVAAEALLPAIEAATIVNAELAAAEERVVQATIRSLPAIAQMNELLRIAKENGGEAGATFASMADSLGIVSAVLANQLVLVLAKADTNTAKLANTFRGLRGNSKAIEQVIREQSMAMVQLLVDTTNAGGGILDALPSLKYMYDALVNGATAAGMDSEAVVQLIKKIGILDGLAPEIQLALTMNTAQITAQIKVLEDALKKAVYGPSGQMSSTTLAMIQELNILKKALEGINNVPAYSGGGSSGGGNTTPDPSNDFSWVAGYVTSLAQFANGLITRDFARDLGTQTAEQINETLVDLLDKMKDLKLDTLPFFDEFRTKFEKDFKDLAVLATKRDELVKSLDIARNGSVDKYSGVTLTKGLGELATALEDVKSKSKDFAKSIADGVMQPIGKGNALTGATNTLTKAKEFFKNITSLRTAGFGPDVIKEVVSAGLVDGNKLAKRLLSMSATDIAEFTRVRSQINEIATATGALASDIVFATELSFAQGAFDAQKLIVQGLETSLATTNGEIQTLITTIQTDLYNTFFEFLSGFQGGIDQLNTFTPLPGSSTTTPGAGGGTTPGGGGGDTSSGGGTTPPVNPFGSAEAAANFAAWVRAESNKLIPGRSYMNWNIGPLPNGGAIVGDQHTYLPPGLDFSGFHAAGGIAMKASLGVIGESGPEAIIPLSKMSQFGSGDTYVTVNVSGNVSSERDLVEAVRVGLLKAQRSNRTLVV
ncbi:Phage tail tape measure protein [uncultured Caudovirales phage]|uniref:Phage tail tape measure protein n=1 Tax=uncultured Caudovirales phage TaxID=2100421 RepID=A0A6J5PXH0_9CAUD|nr:Phage tail tape measure protein [uncultured Caudovirales phage]CAB4176633.1 Phage tail tape measure protein [uncultured Caudovirales phage]CAB4191462.1 Phage tail tape measure protein [uncultured Caudovirales phage]CAB4223227.1 Phage tail tape measure protein [uncultured Caudovirales phage]CAB5220486.1 Phage tail tape measure protein [uncultured Caudovirales phage]